MPSNTLLAIIFFGVAFAKSPSALNLEVGDWLGIDGNWSTIKLTVGSSKQTVSVLASTTLSEFWAIGPGGCLEHQVYCASSRGGIYTPQSSKAWSSLGPWQLGLDYLGYGGNGQYGLDSLNARALGAGVGAGYGGGPGNGNGPAPGNGNGGPDGPGGGARTTFSMPQALMAAINTTDYWIGLFGLGINQGNFGQKVVHSPLTQAVETYGLIPSYTYGYTAGASYRNAPVSLTLGGVDASRLIRNQVEFVLSPDNLPRALVRGMQVEVPGSNETVPKNWASPTNVLSTFDEAFPALIDSTTPFLWLPSAVCQRFATAFNLTYNSTFELYTLSSQQYQDFSGPDFKYNFTFTLSSIDNNDDLGHPLNIPGVVNITLPIQAFVNLLQYPYKNVISYGDPSVPYFALKRSTNSSSFILGRSFLQEAYIAAKYDHGIFRLAQSQYPGRRIPRIIPIKQPDGSPYPPPAVEPADSDKMSIGQMVGAVVGAVALSAICLLGAFCYRRRRNRRRRAEADSEELKDSASTIGHDVTRSPASQILSSFSQKMNHQSHGSESRILDHPAEAPDSAIYELPVAAVPIELDAAEDDGAFLDEVDQGTRRKSLETYELARRRMDRQLQGPAPEYSPPADGVYLPPEKLLTEMSPPHLHPPSEDIYAVSPQTSKWSHDLSPRTPPSTSPISAQSGHNKFGEIPSPATAYIYPQSGSAAMPPLSTRPLQRSPIDPSNIVCIGELPHNLQMMKQNLLVSHAGGSDGRSATVSSLRPGSQPADESRDGGSASDKEQAKHAGSGRGVDPTNNSQYPRSGVTGDSSMQLSISTKRAQYSPEPTSPQPKSAASEERVDGSDLVHVPQLASIRYSWEKE